MSAAIAPVPNDVLAAVVKFLGGILPANTPVLQGMQNRTSMPQVPFVLVTPLYQMRLATNIDTYSDGYAHDEPSVANYEQDTRIDVQLDFYGPNAGAWAAMTSTLWRDEYGVTALAPNCVPLYIDDAKQMPLTTAEQQYLQRWMSTGVLQFNPVVTIPQQFAAAAEADLIDVDEAYPP